jgi:glyoxylase-like metal-dependent hydrolase (beta-lactamase superfamily II)
MRIGDTELQTVSGGAFKLDGGGMFGVIPRPLWSKLYAPDERGRIALDINCLLVRTGDELILIDTGNGPKLSAKEREIFGLVEGDTLLGNLAAVGVRPEEVTMVLLTHLHMDHVGGASHLVPDLPAECGGQESVPSFPNARFLVQRREWEDALHNRSHMRISYRIENLRPLQDSGRLHLLDGSGEVAPGVSVAVTGGHTPAHQCVFIRSGGETALYAGDICPTPAHFRPPYTMAFDMEPYETIQVKADLLHRAARDGWLLFFDHEPVRKVVRVTQEEGQFHAVPVES